ncbi:adenylate/guanylate cyclase family protein [Mycolicibacterium chubuense NBB4]|uniref:Adenylate/guanylate cyclase family protein n=1 Tax=Mycolicibacterium chubuense (strain NBB4) TaxID=710421 RepID=I4BIL1_MYCCN|nr:adenylate/guanylate cyclase domain-containing protein [Mycolicibacterium chubuense]AFM17118.1 adenylate/guanylate cyclase family protein [Mycolicibacterium chubuense NBB4]
MGEQRTGCRACGTVPREGARFCDCCGATLSAPPPVAEYKQVTVLFADVAHSMDIAAVTGAERLREIMSELLDRSTTVVERFGGAVDKFIGDGVMALFGAPVALEDHALRACLAALDIQAEAGALADRLRPRDGIEFAIRVGLNSGEVIAGAIGAAATSYTVIGEQVGLAQRMESVAPPGGVMLSATTARLVEHAVALGDTEWVQIKGATAPVAARRLLAVAAHRGARAAETALVGRSAETAAIERNLDSAVQGRSSVIRVVGPPGIGKSRITREIAATAAAHGIDVFWAYCQSHTASVPFGVATALLRSFFGIASMSPETARGTIRSALSGADPEDLLLLDDMLGVGDGSLAAGDIAPEARRRRLTALLDTALLSRREPALYVVEDAHWIDEASEAMLADFLGVVPNAAALVLVTHRPEYTGALTVGTTSTIRLGPLDQTSAAQLTASLIGTDPSVAELARRVVDRAAGNPFFIEEMVRDLAERHVLEGVRGCYTCRQSADVSVPATVQATIAARIDRLRPAAKRTLNAAAVIGSPFSEELLRSVLEDVSVTELIDADLVAQVGERPVEYAFRHPLMRAVAYESQLKSERAALHRCIASAIERIDPAAAEANAALIATHLDAAGDLTGAFRWHMEAGRWSTHRAIAAARMSWRHAVDVADLLPDTDPHRAAMRIAPRTLLCATIWRVGGELGDVGFDELRDLTTAAGDKRSLAIALGGLVQMLNFHGRYTEASRLASEQVELLDSIGDPELSVALIPMVAAIAKWDAGEMAESLRLAQRAIDLSGGHPTMGNLIFGSPLAMALAMRASTRCCLGIAGWREDFDQALAIARSVDKFSFSTVVMFKYIAVMNWALLPDDEALRDTAEALDIARQFGDDFLLTNAEFTHGLILVRRDDRDRALGFELLAKSREVALAHRYTIIAAWCVDLDVAAEAIRTGDFDTAIALVRAVLDNEERSGEGINRGWSTSVLVEALLGRNGPGDLESAREAIERLAALPTEPVFLYHELPLLRLRAMLARAGGDHGAYAELRDRYRARAEETGFEGHRALARAMP